MWSCAMSFWMDVILSTPIWLLSIFFKKGSSYKKEGQKGENL